MKVEPFDLNDIENEPSDEQLAALMEEVARVARERAACAQESMKRRLQEELETVRRKYLFR
jgi:hypothetical protein